MALLFGGKFLININLSQLPVQQEAKQNKPVKKVGLSKSPAWVGGAQIKILQSTYVQMGSSGQWLLASCDVP